MALPQPRQPDGDRLNGADAGGAQQELLQAQTDRKIVVFSQASEPSSPDFGDIWLDSDGAGWPSYANIKRWENASGGSSGTLAWRDAADDAIGRAHIDAIIAQDAAGSAQDAADGAQGTANSKTTTHLVTSTPSSSLGVNGDWAIRDDSGTIRQYRKAGGTWTEQNHYEDDSTNGAPDGTPVGPVLVGKMPDGTEVPGIICSLDWDGDASGDDSTTGSFWNLNNGKFVTNTGSFRGHVDAESGTFDGDIIGGTINIGPDVFKVNAAGVITYNANSIVFGSGSSAASGNGMALGRGASTSGSDGIAIGWDSSSGDVGAVAVGAGAEASDVAATAYGKDSKATGGESVAIGSIAKSTQANAVAVGYWAESTAIATVTVGNLSRASGARGVAIGYGAKAIIADSVAIGFSADTIAHNEIYLKSANINKRSWHFASGTTQGAVWSALDAVYPRSSSPIYAQGYYNVASNRIEYITHGATNTVLYDEDGVAIVTIAKNNNSITVDKIYMEVIT